MYSERSTPKLKGCTGCKGWNLFLPTAMFWFLCFLPFSVTIWNQVSSSPFAFLSVLILFFVLSCHFLFFNFDLGLKTSPTSSCTLKKDGLAKSICAYMPKEVKIFLGAIRSWDILRLAQVVTVPVLKSWVCIFHVVLLSHGFQVFLVLQKCKQRNVSQEKQQRQIWLSATLY